QGVELPVTVREPRRWMGRPPKLRHDFLDRLGAFDPDQLLVEAAVEIGQAIRLEAELVQDGGVEVFDVERPVRGSATQFVGAANGDAALDAAAGQPHGKAVSIVVATGAELILSRWLPPELAAP